jgi:hypothetical protein
LHKRDIHRQIMVDRQTNCRDVPHTAQTYYQPLSGGNLNKSASDGILESSPVPTDHPESRNISTAESNRRQDRKQANHQDDNGSTPSPTSILEPQF